MTELVLDHARSRLRVHTYAEGLFAKLAHDLALEHTGLCGRADDVARTATIEVPLDGFRVLGALVGTRVDELALSPGDREACLEKMRREVFGGAPGEILRVDVSPDAGVTLRLPHGRTTRIEASPRTSSRNGETHVTASFTLSIAALGAPTIKGPMGAFRVKDRVDVEVELVFAPA